MGLGRLFDQPLPVVIVVLAALLLFGAPSLPSIARSVGQSLRIFKAEADHIRDGSRTPGTTPERRTAEPGDPVDKPAAPDPADQR
ncbi:twin-arginine translocase TatA/TatE family subunit [Arthrobacter sp. GCM10027362]|uniref:twin-arginine translocase TatA/TatE family subunit n=1 Tax=Arthrobacter sp. GCM10027362 TaxID=3273379 RepID=UPI00363C6494